MSVTSSPRLFCLVSANDDLTLLADLARVGVDGFQVRAKDASTAELLTLTEIVLAAVRPFGAHVMVNDRLDVALAADADGVHLGDHDLPVSSARAVAARADRPELIVGATCRSRADVVRAAAAGADYAGFGPLFATTSKSDLPAPLGVAALAPAVGTLPLIAIGGIGPDTAREARAAGASGVAVIGAIWRQPDPVAAAKELVARVA